MPLTLEEDAEVHASNPLWRKYYPGRGTLSLHKDVETEKPVLKWQPDSNIGGAQPKARLYRVVF